MSTPAWGPRIFNPSRHRRQIWAINSLLWWPSRWYGSQGLPTALTWCLDAASSMLLPASCHLRPALRVPQHRESQCRKYSGSAKVTLHLEKCLHRLAGPPPKAFQIYLENPARINQDNLPILIYVTSITSTEPLLTCNLTWSHDSGIRTRTSMRGNYSSTTAPLSDKCPDLWQMTSFGVWGFTFHAVTAFPPSVNILSTLIKCFWYFI